MWRTVLLAMHAGCSTPPVAFEEVDAEGVFAAPAGDLDGDGRDEVLLGVAVIRDDPFRPKMNRWDLVEVRVFDPLERVTKATIHPSAKLTMAVERPDEWTPFVGVGDVNGDGHADIAIGSPIADCGGLARAGAVYLLHGPVTGEVAVDTPWRCGGSEDAELGADLRASRDLDGDGLRDLLMTRREGFGVWLSAQDEVATWRTPGASRVFPAGDTDGDGLGDLLVRTNAADVHEHEVLLLAGPIDTTEDLEHQVDATIHGEHIGAVTRGVGDLDGDGYEDVVVNASQQKRSFLAIFSGPVQDSMLKEADATLAALSDEPPRYHSITGVSAPGDVDHDGENDLVVLTREIRWDTLRGFTRSRRYGQALLVTGPFDGQVNYVDHAEDLGWGAQLRTVGDLDGNGVLDLALGDDPATISDGYLTLLLMQ